MEIIEQPATRDRAAAIRIWVHPGANHLSEHRVLWRRPGEKKGMQSPAFSRDFSLISTGKRPLRAVTTGVSPWFGPAKPPTSAVRPILTYSCGRNRDYARGWWLPRLNHALAGMDHGADLGPCVPPGFGAMIGGPCCPGTTFSATAWAPAGLASPRASPPPSPAGTVASTRSSRPPWTFRSDAADWLRSHFADSRFSVLTLCRFVPSVISRLASFGAFCGVCGGV